MNRRSCHFNDMDSITQRMDENQKIAKDLKEETSVFTNV